MRWKGLLAAMLIILISALLLVTPIGQKYTENIRDFFANKVGSAISTLSSAVLKTKPSGTFTVYLSASRESFYGQSYKISNSTFSVTGTGQSIRIGEQTLTSKANSETSINIKVTSGVLEMLGNGNVKVSGNSDYFEIDDYIFSSGKPVKIEIEINPSTFSLTPLSADKIVFGSVTGEIKRFKGEMGELVDTGSLRNSQLEIRSFSGYIKLDEQGSMILHGLTNNVKGDTFNFV